MGRGMVGKGIMHFLLKKLFMPLPIMPLPNHSGLIYESDQMTWSFEFPTVNLDREVYEHSTGLGIQGAPRG
jgi:hypothetical protein